MADGKEKALLSMCDMAQATPATIALGIEGVSWERLHVSTQTKVIDFLLKFIINPPPGGRMATITPFISFFEALEGAGHPCSVLDLLRGIANAGGDVSDDQFNQFLVHSTRFIHSMRVVPVDPTIAAYRKANRRRQTSRRRSVTGRKRKRTRTRKKTSAILDSALPPKKRRRLSPRRSRANSDIIPPFGMTPRRERQRWTPRENRNLIKLVRRWGPGNWLDIVEAVAAHREKKDLTPAQALIHPRRTNSDLGQHWRDLKRSSEWSTLALQAEADGERRITEEVHPTSSSPPPPPLPRPPTSDSGEDNDNENENESVVGDMVLPPPPPPPPPPIPLSLPLPPPPPPSASSSSSTSTPSTPTTTLMDELEVFTPVVPTRPLTRSMSGNSKPKKKSEDDADEDLVARLVGEIPDPDSDSDSGLDLIDLDLPVVPSVGGGGGGDDDDDDDGSSLPLPLPLPVPLRLPPAPHMPPGRHQLN